MEDDKNYTSRFILSLAACSLLICFIYIYLITFVPIPKGNERYADVCLGFLLGTFMATIVQFFYGSSSNSKDKDAVIKKMSEKITADTEEITEPTITEEVKVEEEKK